MASDNLNDIEQNFLTQIGERVRRVRAIRGMSRKTLAQLTGISERYLAQLETGKGNVSILLLKKIAEVTATRMEDLFVEMHDSSPDFALIRELLLSAAPEKISEIRNLLTTTSSTQKRHIALIGLRGAGKSTLGKALARQNNIDFIELNKQIELEAGLPLHEILSLYGQETYRRFEQSTLAKLALTEKPFILATGGGIVGNVMTFDFLLNNFKTIWVKASPQELMSRVIAQGDLRPMANDKQAMKELITILDSRTPYYARANLVVDTTGLTVDAALNKLSTIF